MTEPSMTVFNQASKVNIGRADFSNVGGNLVNNYNHSVHTGTNSLWNAIAGVGASHNSQQRFPQPRCHPRTRERVIEVLLQWLDSESRELPVCWLSGAAGVGKSAIAQTIAEIRQHEGLVASFFFFRQDPKRNRPDYLVLTIAHGLVENVPELRQPIAQKIAVNPRILEASLQTQFTELVINPLLEQHGLWNRIRRLWAAWPCSSKRRPNLVIVDGLDECTGEDVQVQILSILASDLGKHTDLPAPLRFFVCSRPEPWIREAFWSSHLSKFTKHISLDHSFSSDEDIEVYLRDGFQEIVTSQKYSQVRFPIPWPSDYDISVLVRKARGQFIYPATVLKFIHDGYSHPIEKLRVVLDITPNPLHTSIFQELDDLYRVILSVNSDREALLAILAAILVIPPLRGPDESLYFKITPQFIELLLGLPDGQVALTLRPLHSVLNIHGPEDRIASFHASFSDFLFDPSRSREFFLDRGQWCSFLICRWLRVIVEQSKLGRLHGSSIELNAGFNNVAIQDLWIKWSSVCTSLGYPDEAVVSSLWQLNLGALVTGAIFSSISVLEDREAAPNGSRFYSRSDLLPSLLRNFQAIVDWLASVDSDGTLQDLIERFESAQKGFHIEISPEVAQTFMMWIVLIVLRNPFRSILTDDVDTAMIRYRKGPFDMPKAYYSSCLTSVPLGSAVSSRVLRCPQRPVGHYHVNLRAASVLTLEAIEAKAREIQNNGSELRYLVWTPFVSRLLKQCGPDPRALFLCHSLILAVSKKSINLRSLDQDTVLSWLKAFGDSNKDAVEKVRALVERILEHQNEPGSE